MLKAILVAGAVLTTFDAIAWYGHYRTALGSEIAGAWTWVTSSDWSGVFF
jgi:hypothetical protein